MQWGRRCLADHAGNQPFQISLSRCHPGEDSWSFLETNNGQTLDFQTSGVFSHFTFGSLCFPIFFTFCLDCPLFCLLTSTESSTLRHVQIQMKHECCFDSTEHVLGLCGAAGSVLGRRLLPDSLPKLSLNQKVAKSLRWVSTVFRNSM